MPTCILRGLRGPAWDKTHSRLALLAKFLCVAFVSVFRGNSCRKTKIAVLCGKTLDANFIQARVWKLWCCFLWPAWHKKQSQKQQHEHHHHHHHHHHPHHHQHHRRRHHHHHHHHHRQLYLNADTVEVSRIQGLGFLEAERNAEYVNLCHLLGLTTSPQP